MRTLAQRTARKIFVAVAIVVLDRRRGVLVRDRHAEKAATLVQFLFAITVRQEAEIANALKSVRQNVEQETPDEFIGGQGQRLDLIVMTIILPPKTDLIVVDIEQAVVGDGDAVGIAAHVIQNLLRSSKRRFGVYHPISVPDEPDIAEIDAGLEVVSRLRRTAICRNRKPSRGIPEKDDGTGETEPGPVKRNRDGRRPTVGHRGTARPPVRRNAGADDA